jgi:transcription-repair coupling factor (superfamily II helicase)
MQINVVKKSVSISNIVDKLKTTELYSVFVDFQTNRERLLKVKHLAGSLKALAVVAAFGNYGGKILIVAPNVDDAEKWHSDLLKLFNEERLSLLVEPRMQIRSRVENLDEPVVWLIDGLSKMQKTSNAIAVTTPEIFSLPLPAPDNIEQHRVRLKTGEEIDFLDFINGMMLNGFERREFVSSHGEISIRGGIVDIYPVSWNNPLRIEFFENTIESIRAFDPLSQRSIQHYDEIEFIGNVFHQSDFIENPQLLSFFDNNSIIIIDSPEEIEQSEFSIEQAYKFKTIELNPTLDGVTFIKSVQQPSFQISIQKFAEELNELAVQGYELYLSAEGRIHLERFRDLVVNALSVFHEKNSESERLVLEPQSVLGQITWTDSALCAGFISSDLKIAAFTEHQIFNRQRLISTNRRTKSEDKISLQELRSLAIGDYIVHEDKGIGKFDGFQTIKMGGNAQDCVRLLFAEGDVLYVQLNFIHKLQKYSAQEGVQPKLSKLGSTEWIRRKSRAKKRLKDIARELIKLYAERKMQPGFAFPSDTLWQKEFEASFIYEDTPDQAASTSDVKKDMESETPMDRLVCGDVGFGKTEVALRAAFKAVQAGKQVAMLVPTTILAQQHFTTFSDRLRRYPVIVESLSRLRSAKDQKVVLQKLSEGKVDILIGTHRILSKDIVFHDLGLLIIDEEQRFGVGAKEKLRQMRVSVDTLTLTATPIPRTLNFSLMGARDMSVIETPPRNRVPIHTEIIEWKPQLIKNAIMREIERNGQVFFVSDRVDDLDKIRMDLQMLLPTIRFGIAHGQMTGKELESVMDKFISKKIDVLVATKIIESGLDIPNANTIIINRSHHFGLAELYQLRGRVGRSNLQAFCYLIVPPVKTISTQSLRRLQAIEEFTDLGSGFQLSMRDLEIRGAGNLLGPEQSGYINEIGFDLYQKILNEAVAELKSEEFSELYKEKKETATKRFRNDDMLIEIDSDAFIPPDYIRSDTDRFLFYKRLYNTSSNDEILNLLDEIKDRYGKIPRELHNLVIVVKTRMNAAPLGFEKLLLKRNMLVAELPGQENKEYYESIFPALSEYLQDEPSSRFYQKGRILYLEIGCSSYNHAIEILWKMKKTVETADL